jgi:cytochrome c oxidase assembly protein subunit 15
MTAPPESRPSPPPTVAAGSAAARPDRWRPSPPTVRRSALVALLANIAIVASGGLVRLTDSGLGCPSWPDCTGSSLVPTRQLSWHKYVEFGNRLFTYVVLAAVVVALVAVLRARPRRRDLRRWAWLLFLGVPAQAVMGGITVLTHLNPWAVAAHFVLSMFLVAAATVLWWRARVPELTPSEPTIVHPLLRRLAWATWAVTFAVFCVGTVVTGSGPHAGDPAARRIGTKPVSISQLHADVVMLLIGMAPWQSGPWTPGLRRSTRPASLSEVWSSRRLSVSRSTSTSCRSAWWSCTCSEQRACPQARRQSCWRCPQRRPDFRANVERRNESVALRSH